MKLYALMQVSKENVGPQELPRTVMILNLGFRILGFEFRIWNLDIRILEF